MRSTSQRDSTFSDRLSACLAAGQLTVADAALWFGRPHSTVRMWIKLERAPRGPQGAFVEQRLGILERAIRGKRFPLDPCESQQLRPQTIERIRNELERAELPARHSA